MSKTLILSFHPNLAASRASAALIAAARVSPDVEVVDIAGLYPAGEIDAAVEAARLLTARRLAWLFPVQWYAPPATLKAWQDAVLTRMYYVAYEAEGRRLEGTPLLVAATAGADAETYGPQGANLYPLNELFRPLQTAAHRCGLPWADPFVVYRANKLSADEAADAGRSFADRLSAWRDAAAR